MNTSHLLIQENPLQVLPQLATKIGLNEAIVLQQIHYWLVINEKAGKNFEDGCYWSYNSYDDWREKNFPFWSLSTVKRVFGNLKKKNLIRSEQRRKKDYDRRVWVTIRYDELAKLNAEKEKENVSERECQIDTVKQSKVEQSTSTETNAETNSAAAPGDTEKPQPPAQPKPRDTFFDAIIQHSFGVTPGDKEREKLFGGRVGKIKNAIVKVGYTEQDYRKAVADFKAGFPDGDVPSGTSTVVRMIDKYKKGGDTRQENKLSNGMTEEEFSAVAKAVVEAAKAEKTQAEKDALAKFNELMGDGDATSE